MQLHKIVSSAAAALAIVLGGNGVHDADACTMIAVGKNATTDGSTLMAHTDDAGGGAADLRLVRVPAQNHTKGSQRAVYSFFGGYPRLVAKGRGPHYEPKSESEALMEPLGFIPQVEHTYAYFDLDYGMMNEVQLSIAESTCGAKTVGWSKDLPYGSNLFGIAELSKVALERCDSARCAIQTMGDLAVEYGFFSEDSGDPASPGYVDSAEALGIADRYGEVWIFHVLTGKNNASAVWAAQRVPDDHVASVANAFMIRDMDLEDTKNFMASSNVLSFAQEMGWWDPQKDGPFDFTAAYGIHDVDPVRPLYTGRRVWRIFDRIAPSLKLDSRLGLVSQYRTYPFSVKTEKPLNPNAVMNLLRDYFQDTEYDMSKGAAAGPFGSPIRWDGDNKGVIGGWERPVSSFRTMYSFIMQARSFLPDGIGGVVWYGQSSPHTTVYVPFSCRQNEVPSAYLESVGKQSEMNLKSAWWAFNFVKNWSQLRFDAMSQDIYKKIAELQEAAFVARAAMEAQVKKEFGNTSADSQAIDAYLEKHSNAFAASVVDHWWQFAWQLVGKFADGYVTTGETPEEMVTPGYPAWWLQATEYSKWPGDSFLPKGSVKKDVGNVPRTPTSPGGANTATSSEDQYGSWSIAIAQIGGGLITGAVVGAAIMWVAEKRRRSGYEALL